MVSRASHPDPPGIAADLAILYKAASDVFLDEYFDELAAIRARHEEFVRHTNHRNIDLARKCMAAPIRIEYARAVLNISGADSAEHDPASSHQVITPLSCALPPRRAGGPRGSGEEQLKILPGTRLRSIYGNAEASEQYYCNYGVNEEYEKQFQ